MIEAIRRIWRRCRPGDDWQAEPMSREVQAECLWWWAIR